MALYMGIDVGGTTVKGLVTDEKGKLICQENITTRIGEELADCIVELADILVRRVGETYSGIAGIGVCCPGTIDGNGSVIFSGNLKLRNYPLQKLLTPRFCSPVKVLNDGNAAALGEAKFGAGKGYKNSILVTLGTGVGGGIVIGGKLFTGNKGAGAEIGHMVIERGGDVCTCGRRGCFEAYCSARALTERTKWAMEEDTSSEMWKTYTYATADGRTAFEYMDTDRTALLVVNRYIKYLACGLTNLANIFRPEVILIGGGVAAQGTRLTNPLQKLIDEEIFGGQGYAPVRVECASLGNRAGGYGAAAYVMKK